MPKIATYLGYASVMPFIGLTIAVYSFSDIAVQSMLVVVLIAYAGMIATFLAGVHWPVAMHKKDDVHLSLSMVPALFGLIAVCSVLFLAQIVWFLVIMALVFWVLYLMDRKYLPEDGFAPGYFDFRRNLTVIISVSLALSALRFVI